MKIVFLQDDFPPHSFGGAGISTYELAHGMHKAGHEVFVITTCRNTSEAGERAYNGLTVHSIASSYNGAWRAYVSINNRKVVGQIGEILYKIKPDVVHANNIHAHLSWASLKAAKRHARVVVWTARDTMAVCYGKLDTERYLTRFDARTTWLDHLMQARKRFNPLRNYYIKKYLAYADKKFAVSDALRDALAQNGIRGVQTMHTGMDTSAWQAPQAAVEKFRAAHAVAGKRVLLFGGRLSAEKGGGVALQALALVVKEVPDAVLLVAGVFDDFARAMQAEAKKLGVGEHVMYTGWISGEDVVAAYAASDVVLVPSRYLDPFPRTVLEGMAAGKPVVATCYGGAPEAVVDTVTGYIVNPLHPEALAEKTLDLLKNPAKAAAFGAAGFERVKARFNRAAVVEQYLLCYSRFL